MTSNLGRIGSIVDKMGQNRSFGSMMHEGYLKHSERCKTHKLIFFNLYSI